MSDLFDFDRPPPLFALMGNPVSHSKSPGIHQLFGQQCGIQLDYRAIQVDPGGFAQAVSNFEAAGGRGLNITLPFKLEAWQLADHRSALAELGGAVNTLKFGNGKRYGDNTDGTGLCQDLVKNLNCPIQDRRILVLGAGGAVRGILQTLLAEAPKKLVIANRTVDKAVALVDLFSQLGPVTACGYPDLAGQQFDLIINGTSASVRSEVPPVPPDLFSDQVLAYDLMYADQATSFLAFAQKQGVGRCADGFGMLVEQAAESFFIWHGVRPETGPMLEQLRG